MNHLHAGAWCVKGMGRMQTHGCTAHETWRRRGEPPPRKQEFLKKRTPFNTTYAYSVALLPTRIVAPLRRLARRARNPARAATHPSPRS